jgi:aryl-alcohol dehydrogenase-like predicted oxidoreductase
VSAQNNYSFLQRDIESDLIPALRRYGIGLLPYFPLASGILTGKYKRGNPAPDCSRIQAWGKQAWLTDHVFDVVETLQAFAAERSVTLLEVAIGGLAAQPAVASVIAGATSAEQVAANVRAVAWQPSMVDLATIDQITKPAH